MTEAESLIFLSGQKWKYNLILQNLQGDRVPFGQDVLPSSLITLVNPKMSSCHKMSDVIATWSHQVIVTSLIIWLTKVKSDFYLSLLEKTLQCNSIRDIAPVWGTALISHSDILKSTVQVTS